MLAKSECDALVDETYKLGLYVTVEPKCRCYPYAGLCASKLYSSRIASVDKCTYPRGQEKPPSENVAPLLINDQKIVAYQRVIAGDNRRKITETRRKLPAMNIVQTPKKRPYDTPTISSMAPTIYG